MILFTCFRNTGFCNTDFFLYIVRFYRWFLHGSKIQVSRMQVSRTRASRVRVFGKVHNGQVVFVRASVMRDFSLQDHKIQVVEIRARKPQV